MITNNLINYACLGILKFKKIEYALPALDRTKARSIMNTGLF